VNPRWRNCISGVGKDPDKKKKRGEKKKKREEITA